MEKIKEYNQDFHECCDTFPRPNLEEGTEIKSKETDSLFNEILTQSFLNLVNELDFQTKGL